MKDCPKIKNYLKDKYKYKDNIIYTILASVIAARCLTVAGRLVLCDQYLRLIQHACSCNLGSIAFSIVSWQYVTV